MSLLKKIKKYKFVVLGIVLSLVITIVGFSYAYYNANVTIVSETQTIIRSKKLALTFNDTKEVNSTDMMPGKSVVKTFNVVSTAEDTVTYNIKFNDITNTYNEDVVFTLIKDGKEVVTQTPLPDTSEKEYIYTTIDIEPGVTHDYVLKITYLSTDKEQVLSKDDIFRGTVEIDVDEVDNELLYVPYTTNEISSTDVTEEDTIINEFTVRNTSAKQTQTYNVLLEDIVNEYEDGELTYTFEKNGEEVSSGDVPQAGESPYLTTDEELTTGQTDTYELTITENIDNTVAYVKERYTFSLLSNAVAENSLSKNFSAKVVVNSNEVDITKPECNITGLPEDWVTSATLTINGTDENGLATNAYSWDGNTYSTTQTKTINANGTYTAYVKDKVGNVQSCSATISKIDTTAPETSTIAINSFSGTNVTLALGGTDSESGISKYVVKYGTSASALTNSKTVTTTENNTTTTITVTHGSTYYFQVDVYNGTGTLYKSSDVISKTFNAYRYYTTSSSIGTTLVSTGQVCASSTCSGYNYTTLYATNNLYRTDTHYTYNRTGYPYFILDIGTIITSGGANVLSNGMKISLGLRSCTGIYTHTQLLTFTHNNTVYKTPAGSTRTYSLLCNQSVNGTNTYYTFQDMYINGNGRFSYKNGNYTITGTISGTISTGWGRSSIGWVTAGSRIASTSTGTRLWPTSTISNCKGSACAKYNTLYRTDTLYSTYTTYDKNTSVSGRSYFTTSYEQE